MTHGHLSISHCTCFGSCLQYQLKWEELFTTKLNGKRWLLTPSLPPTPSSIPNNINLYVRFYVSFLMAVAVITCILWFYFLVKKKMHVNSHSLLVGNVDGMATLEDSLAVSHKTKHALTAWSRNFAPWYLLKTVENMSTQKTYTQCLWQLYSSLSKFGNAKELFFSRWIDKCTVAHLDNGILFSTKKQTSPLWKDMKRL